VSAFNWFQIHLWRVSARLFTLSAEVIPQFGPFTCRQQFLLGLSDRFQQIKAGEGWRPNTGCPGPSPHMTLEGARFKLRMEGWATRPATGHVGTGALARRPSTETDAAVEGPKILPSLAPRFRPVQAEQSSAGSCLFSTPRRGQ